MQCYLFQCAFAMYRSFIDQFNFYVYVARAWAIETSTMHYWMGFQTNIFKYFNDQVTRCTIQRKLLRYPNSFHLYMIPKYQRFIIATSRGLSCMLGNCLLLIVASRFIITKYFQSDCGLLLNSVWWTLSAADVNKKLGPQKKTAIENLQEYLVTLLCKIGKINTAQI